VNRQGIPGDTRRPCGERERNPLALTCDESDATLTGLPSGAAVKVKITAANDAPASAEVQAGVK
jgi:hypothetical protein